LIGKRDDDEKVVLLAGRKKTLFVHREQQHATLLFPGNRVNPWSIRQKKKRSACLARKRIKEKTWPQSLATGVHVRGTDQGGRGDVLCLRVERKKMVGKRSLPLGYGETRPHWGGKKGGKDKRPGSGSQEGNWV